MKPVAVKLLSGQYWGAVWARAAVTFRQIPLVSQAPATTLRRVNIADISRATLRVFEIVLVILIAFLLAKLIWMPVRLAVSSNAPPIQNYQNSPRASNIDIEVLSSFDPFHHRFAEATTALLVDAPETTLSLKLHGVRVGSGEKMRGSAIILTPDNKQASYRVGEEIMEGVSLHHIAANGVIIRRNGISESLFFEGDESGKMLDVAPRVRVAAPLDGSRVEAGRVSAVEIASAIKPLLKDGAIIGYVLEPSADQAEALSVLGLQPGDVVVAVNGQTADSLGLLQQFTRELKPGDSIELEVDREGVRRSFEIVY